MTSFDTPDMTRVLIRSAPCLGHSQAIGALAHRQRRPIWLILHRESVAKNGPSGDQTIEAKTPRENDPPTSKPSAIGSNHQSSTGSPTSALVLSIKPLWLLCRQPNEDKDH